MLPHTEKTEREKKEGEGKEESEERKPMPSNIWTQYIDSQRAKKKNLQTILNSILNRFLPDSDMAPAILKLFYVDYWMQ